MNKQSATYVILTILIAVIAVNYWPEPSVNQEIEKAPSNADNFLKEVSIKQFDSNGLIENQLNAVKLEHFKTNQVSEIVQPQIVINSSNQSTWKLSAKTGKLNHSNNLVELKGAVIMEQTKAIDKSHNVSTIITSLPSSTASIKTEDLNFNLNNNTAQTKSEVLITTKSSNTKAKEMVADFENNIIELYGQTKTKGNINGSK